MLSQIKWLVVNGYLVAKGGLREFGKQTILPPQPWSSSQSGYVVFNTVRASSENFSSQRPKAWSEEEFYQTIPTGPLHQGRGLY